MENYYYAFKGLRVGVTPDYLTEADRLNGVEWKGRTEIVWSAERENLYGTWSDWQNGIMMSTTRSLDRPMVKRKGQWSFPGNMMIDPKEWKTVNCDKLPPGF